MSESLENNSKPAKVAKSAKASKPAKPAKVNKDNLPNPVWFKPVMFGFMLLGLAWIITFYISGAQLPLGGMFPEVNIGSWNIAIGFGLLMVGFGMATRWK
jgi:hypothetical protein